MAGTKWQVAAAMTAVAAFTAACGGVSEASDDPRAHGRVAFSAYGCATCHALPDMPRPHGRVGPNLAGLSEQRLIAGRLPNTPENLARWIREPQSIAPGSGMPDLEVSEQDARDLVAFLYEQ